MFRRDTEVRHALVHPESRNGFRENRSRMPIQLDETSSGILFQVKAQPGARRNGVTGEHAGALKVAVTQAPEKGKANDAIIDVLVEALDLKRNQIELVSGLTSPQKKFLVTGITRLDLEERIRSIL